MALEYNEDSLDDLCDKFKGVNSSEPKQIERNEVVKEILEVFGKLNDTLMNEHVLNEKYEPYSLHTLSSYSRDYRSVSAKFELYGLKVATRIGNYWKNTKMSIIEIKKVVNPFLTAQFELKKQRKREIYSRCNTECLFHGTEGYNIKNICINNFDWRLHGTNVGHKFGQGVSFSPKAGYASDYPRFYSQGSERTMILVQTVYARRTIGDGSMVIPPEGFDASTRDNGMVVVYYEDADFNPEFVIHYTK